MSLRVGEGSMPHDGHAEVVRREVRCRMSGKRCTASLHCIQTCDTVSQIVAIEARPSKERVALVQLPRSTFGVVNS
jgi:hypothetical protein